MDRVKSSLHFARRSFLSRRLWMSRFVHLYILDMSTDNWYNLPYRPVCLVSILGRAEEVFPGGDESTGKSSGTCTVYV